MATEIVIAQTQPHDYPYPTSHTIKGLQVNMLEDAIALGVGHAALNLSQNTLQRHEPSEDSITYQVDGKEFYFDRHYVEQFDNRVRTLSENGIVVNLILLNSPSWEGIQPAEPLWDILRHPRYDKEGFISAFNVVTPEGLELYRAFVEFVAERYTRPDAAYGRACGYIIGNEVNSQWIWSNAGLTTCDDFVKEYVIALRTAYQAARRKYAQSRIYVSLDHLWTIPHKVESPDDNLRYYCGRDILEKLAELTQGNDDFEWSIAYHPYPENLFKPDFWNDKTALDTFDSPRITFKNIEVLCCYMQQPRMLFEGKPRAIILSEQGFHSDESPEGERLQAAAYAYAYHRVEQNPAIESFILHAHVDHRDEFGLNLGLWRRDKTSDKPNAPGSPKPVHAVFRDIDGKKHDIILEQAKAIVGEENWR